MCLTGTAFERRQPHVSQAHGICAGHLRGPGSIEDMSGGFDLAGVAEEWDNTPDIRERIRRHKCFVLMRKVENGPLEVGFVQKTVLNLKSNAQVLAPALSVMREHHMKVPGIDAVLEQVQQLFESNGVAEDNVEQVYKEAWAVRRLITFAKSLTYKKVLPQESFL